MPQELNVTAVRRLNKNIKLSIQAAKVDGSKRTINKLQSRGQRVDGVIQGEFAPNKDITSYVVSKHQQNKYNDISKFYSTMLKGEKWWDKRFYFFGPPTGGNNERIVQAAAMAIEITERQTASYPKNYSSAGPRQTASTGHLKRSISPFVNGKYSLNPARDIASSSGSALFELANIAEYGSTAEARAVYVTRQNGLIFYAANRVQSKFPELGIMFRFAEAADFGLPHVYNVPVLTIGSPEDVNGPWVRPGGNIRKERKRNRRMASAAARITRKFNG
jgi:hypothetical protein